MIDIKIFWHKNPDTDSVISAIVFADYLNQKWYNTTAYKLWELNNETKYILELFWEKTPETITNLPEGTRVWLVDHNETIQSIDGREKLEIEYLIDHHRIDFRTSSPLIIRTEKLWSTASILYKMYKESNFEINQRTAKLILSAIISDTLLFKSATTTKFDIEIAKELQIIANIDNLENFAMKMFDAKSDLWNISPEEIIKYDYKEFNLNWTKVWIWHLDTTNANFALWKKDELLEAMQNIKNNSWLDFIMLSIVDIIWENNTSLVLDWKDSDIIENIFEEKVKNNLVDLKRRLSRKKQIVPDLTKYFENN